MADDDQEYNAADFPPAHLPDISLQKVYDESYLACSTAIHYEVEVCIPPRAHALRGIC
jgi:hypothetical protein